MKLAIVFPGQGSQSVGMLKEFTDAWPIVEETFRQASDALGYDLWDIVQNGPADKLNQTAITQPAMLAADVCVMRILSERSSLEPIVLAGHSLGEYAALVAAGSLGFEDAVKLVSLRGQLMQDAVPEGEGAMAAIIGLDDEVIISTCAAAAAEAGAPVEAVNFNSPGQVVIAGAAGAVKTAIEKLKAAGAKRAMPLPVSVPSHSSLMEPAAQKLAEALEEVSIQTPSLAVIQNVSAESYTSPEDIKQALAKQLHNPVQWVKTMSLIASEADAVLECGPGKVLTGLSKRIAKDLPAHALGMPDSMQAFLDSAA